MYKLSEMVGKDVIGLYEAKRAGTLIGAVLDKSLGRVRGFEVLVSDEDELSRKFFSPECLFAMDGDAIVIKNCGRLAGRYSLPASYVRGPINASAYSPDGRLLGRVNDLTIDGPDVVAINVGELSFPPESVVARSDELVIVNDRGEKIKLVPPAVKRVPAPRSAHAEAQVFIHSDESSAREKQSAPAADEREDKYAFSDGPEGESGGENPSLGYAASAGQRRDESDESDESPTAERQADGRGADDGKIDLPVKLGKDNVSVTHTPATSDNRAAGYAFLLGKTVTRDLLAESGEKLASAGDVVDDGLLTAAADGGKLVLLALCSR